MAEKTIAEADGSIDWWKQIASKLLQQIAPQL
jgi:hypothetical protein